MPELGEALARRVAGQADVELARRLLRCRQRSSPVALLGEVDGRAARRPPAVDVVEQQHVACRASPCPRARRGPCTRSSCSAPGSRLDMRESALEAGARRAATRCKDDLIGAGRLDVVGVISLRSSTLTCSFFSWPSIPVAESAPISPRSGCRPPGGTGRRARPTSRPGVTRWPRSAATRAASRPAGPPPTTSTFLGFGAGGEAVAVPFESRAPPKD